MSFFAFGRIEQNLYAAPHATKVFEDGFYPGFPIVFMALLQNIKN
jgi:hypothetical protein